jgi:hypothetical protein
LCLRTLHLRQHSHGEHQLLSLQHEHLLQLQRALQCGSHLLQHQYQHKSQHLPLCIFPFLPCRLEVDANCTATPCRVLGPTPLCGSLCGCVDDFVAADELTINKVLFPSPLSPPYPPFSSSPVSTLFDSLQTLWSLGIFNGNEKLKDEELECAYPSRRCCSGSPHCRLLW